MVFQSLDIGPNRQPPVKGMNSHAVSMQLGAQGTGEQLRVPGSRLMVFAKKILADPSGRKVV